MWATSNEELVGAFLAAMGRADINALSEMLADDATWWLAGDLPVSGLYRGKAAVIGEFLWSAAVLFEPGSLSFELRNTIIAAGSVIAEYIGTGRALNGGGQYRNTYCTIFECRDGQITAVREHFDSAHARRVLYPTNDCQKSGQPDSAAVDDRQ
ncbi:nuclear transport factor 2 family protein [Mycobacteroides abscessus]|uniref:nuclear transport factor 2 family protein n=1 Tax=Mycobacteroides abscessus TaxID=36809 RepID=UPI000301B1E8|nr:nuclear transport factor 2 family protein [Mycobacteroides abscessus]RIR60953.1 nuclear transport factor 2 family protein [Mycobacteroides abscessus]RIR98011.1 nuclear transport factor 2 family protein [Mycobacteroides abscessus]RIS71444.1 nuclear transport factor 2 family protein [Mycobacteroides abscessus]RIS80317.1 nuclear transport factor 2 family protein [Mycobacteroides abscessus]